MSSGLSYITDGVLSRTNTVQLEQVKPINSDTTVELDNFDISVELDEFEITVEVCNL